MVQLAVAMIQFAASGCEGWFIDRRSDRRLKGDKR